MRFGKTARGVTALTVTLALAACNMPWRPVPRQDQPAQTQDSTALAGQIRPQARPGGGVIQVAAPSDSARTVEQFDTTSAAQRRAAAAPPAMPEGEQSLGQTVASLGDPSRPGFWLETPLVERAQTGRVALNGQSAQVDLIPIEGPRTGGSRISLAAMRLIGAPLTDLPMIEVFAGG